MWGDDSTVSVVDRTPVLNFDARPAAFGPAEDVLGYLIRVEDFSVPCDGRSGGGDGDGDGGEPVGDEDGDVEDHRGNSKPWWPDDGREWEPMEHKLDARHGCPRLCMRGKDRPQSSETWMALVMRGGCTFVDKVRGAQRFGAKGVVVGGETEEQDRNGDGLVQMFSLGMSFCVLCARCDRLWQALMRTRSCMKETHRTYRSRPPISHTSPTSPSHPSSHPLTHPSLVCAPYPSGS